MSIIFIKYFISIDRYYSLLLALLSIFYTTWSSISFEVCLYNTYTYSTFILLFNSANIFIIKYILFILVSVENIFRMW